MAILLDHKLYTVYRGPVIPRTSENLIIQQLIFLQMKLLSKSILTQNFNANGLLIFILA